MMLNCVPEGCQLELVTNDDSAPHLRAGEFAFIDMTDIDPKHDQVIERQTLIQQVIAEQDVYEVKLLSASEPAA